jgi:hypothetical protein
VSDMERERKNVNWRDIVREGEIRKRGRDK